MKNPFRNQTDPVSADELIQELENELRGRTIRPEVASLVIDFIRREASAAVALGIIWETERMSKAGMRETFYKLVGFEPAQAILTFDQLHHRIQHEGLADYD